MGQQVKAHEMAEGNFITTGVNKGACEPLAQQFVPAPGWVMPTLVPRALQPWLAAGDLVLRPYEAGDVPGLVELCKDARVSAMTRTLPHPYTRADAENFVERAMHSWETGQGVQYAVMLNTHAAGAGETGDAGNAGDAESANGERGELVAGCGCTFDEIDLRAELGYMVRPDKWGQGIATRAAQAVVDCVFTHTILRKLTAHYLQHNPASGRVLALAGFQQEGVLRGQAYKYGSEYDLIAVGLLRTTWEARRAGL